MTTNEYNQPIGEALPNFLLGEMPSIKVLEGVYCRLEHLSAEKHLDDLSEFYLELIQILQIGHIYFYLL